MSYHRASRSLVEISLCVLVQVSQEFLFKYQIPRMARKMNREYLNCAALKVTDDALLVNVIHDFHVTSLA